MLVIVASSPSLDTAMLQMSTTDAMSCPGYKKGDATSPLWSGALSASGRLALDAFHFDGVPAPGNARQRSLLSINRVDRLGSFLSINRLHPLGGLLASEVEHRALTTADAVAKAISQRANLHASPRQMPSA